MKGSKTDMRVGQSCSAVRLSFLIVSFFPMVLIAETTYTRSMERVSSMDPAEASSMYAARAVQLVYETLLEYDYAVRPYRLIPGLARQLPESQSNGCVWVFSLHPEARFQPDPCFGRDASGQPLSRPVTADDVVYSFKRLADRKNASPGAWIVEDTILGMRMFAEQSVGPAATDYAQEIPGLRAADARTLRVELTKPLYVFPYYLTLAYAAVVPREAVAYYGDAFGDHAVGSGPYRLALWRRNHQMSYRRDPTWRGWSEGPARIQDAEVPFDRVNYRMIDDVSTQWLCFLKGEIDFLGEIARDNWDVVADATGRLASSLSQKGIVLHAMPTLEVAYLGLNMEDPVLGPNRALRQALNCAIDTAAWERFFNQRVLRADGPVPPGIRARLEAPFAYAFDLAKARRLLCEAGYPGGIDPQTGRRLQLTLDMGRTTQDVRESAELLVSFYAQIGIALKPHYHNWPTFLKRVANRQSQMFRVGWVGDYPDAENFLQLFYGRNVSPGPNRVNYVNPAFDRLYEAACAATDETQRDTIWHAAQALIREECPWVFLNYQKSYTLCHPRVLNYQPTDFPYGTEKYLRIKSQP